MADTFKFVQTQKTTLYGSGATATDTSITLSSFFLPDGLTQIAMTDFGTVGFGTIEPGTGREEMISFTGITDNGDDTVTLTGVTRGLRFVAPYDEVSGNKFAHAGGSTFVITNTAGFYNKIAAKDNDETITGKYSFNTIPESSDTPLSDTDIATKKYVDDNVNGGAVSINRIVTAGTAGEAVSAGQLVYLKVSDGKWWKTDADTVATISNVQLGITQGAGDADGLITGGVLTKGVHTTTGLTANSLYYASNTAGAIATTAGTFAKVIGQATSTTSLMFDPVFYTDSAGEPTAFVSTSAGAADSGKGVKLNASGVLDDSFIDTNDVIFGDVSDGDTIISVETTLTTNKYYKNLVVNAGVSLITAGNIIYATSISNAGTISNNGGNGGNGGNATAGVGGTAGTAGAVAAGGTVAAGKTGKAGGAGGAGAAAGSNGTAGDATNPSIGASGVAGGGGGGGTGGAGTAGGGGAATGEAVTARSGVTTASLTSGSEDGSYQSAKFVGATSLTTLSVCGGSGSGGGGGGSTSGGGGGGGGSGATGGLVVLIAETITNTGTISANGGNGGNGGNGLGANSGAGGGGGGGNGGNVFLLYKTLTAGTIQVNGGAFGSPGTPSGTGNAGANGTVGTAGKIFKVKITK